MPELYQKLGFGTAGLTSMKTYGSVIRLLETAFNSGITHFDTAPLYGQGYAEDLVGRFIKNKRHKLTITTKFGLGSAKPLTVPVAFALPLNYYRKALKKAPPPVQQGQIEPVTPALLPYRRITTTEIHNSLTQSLKRLQTNYIDYYFLHEGLPGFLDQDAHQYLLDQQQKGHIRFLGVATGSQNLLTLTPGELLKWDVLQYEAGSGGLQLKQQFPGKQHFIHSCLKDLNSRSIPPGITENIGGYKLAAYAKDPGNNKLLFSTRRLEILKQNLEGFKGYIQ
ncbi:aldo/keto reductase [Paraflavitalea soli]|uniref:Aldo/keto reductase n=1 Tax=Paraflavitalea soli TaxID=2315862 RepID=A0A3B7MVR9_9BACT|nr:aldo/keto reductase [Paraflavitalea soli]AXY77106.1 aldo/keto reductase [Paraflavitalea soli]